ncbi:MAG: hypothetical protein A3E83_05065 [Gammaproteobacteria bacterium RIFCSPHIGHO2_12_FULL_41_20]|nr:MAG: hypothetical protein A3E83_05065 [Gammaproteobacteria bacterium RIFCSPHIGHO2_12_FULL_41_20]
MSSADGLFASRKEWDSQISFIPPEIDRAHLHANGKLLTQQEIEAAGKIFIHDPQVQYQEITSASQQHYLVLRLVHPQTGCPHDYAVYLAQSLGRGSFAEVRLMQALDTGDWYAVKIFEKPQAIQVDFMPFSSGIPPVSMPVFSNLSVSQASSTRENPFSSISVDDVHGSGAVNERPSADESVAEDTDYYDTEAKRLFKINQEIAMLRQANQMIGAVDIHGTHYVGLKLARGKPLSKLSNEINDDKLLLSISTYVIREFIEIIMCKVLHCDINPDNIMYDLVNSKVTVIDFGSARALDAPPTDSPWARELLCAPDYTAPELYRTLIPNEKTEVYALGMSLAVFCKLVTEGEIFTLVDAATVNNPTRKRLLNYLAQMTDSDPVRRPSMQSALEFFSLLVEEPCLALRATPL